MRKREMPTNVVFMGICGAPKGIRTSGLPLRRRSLYPAELRRQAICIVPCLPRIVKADLPVISVNDIMQLTAFCRHIAGFKAYMGNKYQ